jgi:hypothetical protein
MKGQAKAPDLSQVTKIKELAKGQNRRMKTIKRRKVFL